MKMPYFWKGLAIFVVLVCLAGLAYAVDVNARIKGTVTDPQGSALAGANVIATNLATGVKYTTVSAANGTYLFPQLPIGTYSISASATGFKTFSASGIVLNIDQEYVEPIQLQLGSTSEVVEVQASAVQVNTTDMQLSNVVNSEQMVELPLINRAFTGLELTLPGVQAPSDRFGGNYSVSGGQTQQSEYLINGADSNDIALNTLALTPNLDAIDQFNLIDGPMNAEYDRNSGGIVSATIKQGSNQFHGDAFEYYRDTFLNTLNYFQKSVTTGKGVVPTFHQHIFGGVLGGPIVRKKLFFFGAYQGTRQTTPQGGGTGNNVYASNNLNGDFSADLQGGNGVRPTAAQTYGSFSNAPIPATISIPGCSTAGETWAQCAFDLGGIFPTTSFNSIATKLVSKYVPAPNSGTYGYIFNPNSLVSQNQEIGRVDYAINPANQVTFLMLYQKQTTTNTLPFTGATLPGFGELDALTVSQYTGDYVHQFSPTLVNDFSAHYTRFNFQAVTPQNVVSPASLGFNIIPQDAAAASVPTISVSGNFINFTLGFSTNGPQPRIDQVYQLDDSVSKVVGQHTFKFGYDGRRFNVTNPFYARNSGSFGFNNTGTYSTGDGALDFLLGDPASYNQGTGATIQADAFLNYFYAQDTWKLTNALTLSYGMGYSIDTPLRNHQYSGEGIACIVAGEQSNIFPNAPKGLVYPGDPGCNNAGQAYTRYSEFGPRLGFAWAPDLGPISGTQGKFSIRGGFGIYYDRTEEESALQTLATPPFGTTTEGAQSLGAPQFADPFSDLNNAGSVPNPFPYKFPVKGQNIDFGALEPIYNISTFAGNFRAPYAENFQLSIEREFPSKVVARFSYVGSVARQNQITTNANPITQAGHAACVADTTYCNNPTDAIYRNLQSYFFPNHTLSGSVDPNTGEVGYLDVGLVGSGSSSSYHSFQANIQKGMTHGLLFQLSYTYSHALDSGSSFENAGFGESSARGYNQFAPSLNYGDSAFDARQRLVFSPIYVTPIRRDMEWYKPLNLLTSGWEISGITTLATGFPFDVSYAGGTSDSEWCPFYTNYYACPDIPNQVAPIVTGNLRQRLPSNGHSVGILKTSFANEPLGSFGNTHRNPYHGPGINNTNMIIAKNINMSQDGLMKLQLRMESDNVFNHTQFANPGTTWNDFVLSSPNSTFGQVSSAAASRLTQLAMRFYF